MANFFERSRQEYNVPPWAAWTVAALCIALGVLVTLCFGKPKLDLARASTRWPTTDGLVEVSEVGRKTESNGEIRYFTQIRYSYSVDGRRFESKTVWVGDDYFSPNPTSHEEVVRRYPINGRVTVHYDPSRPQIAVLEPGLFFSNYSIFIAGLAFIGVGFWVVRIAIRERLRQMKGKR